MVFFYQCICNKNYKIYMGKDKFENETLIKFAFPEDIWFHVDDLSSAHVYLRPPFDFRLQYDPQKGDGGGGGEDAGSWAKAPLTKPVDHFHAIPEDVLMECAHLVKFNSIQGSKLPSVNVVYTPASNLLKTNGMEVGQVSYKDTKLIKKVLVPVKKDPVVNALTRARKESFPDLEEELRWRMEEERGFEKKYKEKLRLEEKRRIAENKKRKEQESYSDLFAGLEFGDEIDDEEDTEKRKNLEEDFW